MKLENAQIIFMGTSFFAKEILKYLIENNLKIKLVVTQPDKPAGRNKALKFSEVKIFAQENNLKLEQFSQLDDQALDVMKKIKPDLVIVASYGLIIPQKMLGQPQYGYINIHPSLLPKFRGSTPIQTALQQGLKETGVTIMKMDSKMDSGPILSQKKIEIDPKDTYLSLEKKLLETTGKFLSKTLGDYLEEKIHPQEQDHSQASYTKMIGKQDGKIDWSKNSDEIYNQFRAFYNWPQVYTFWKDKKITLLEIEKTTKEIAEKKIGTIYEFEGKILVKTGKGSIILKKIKLEGKKDLAIKDFLNGNPGLVGSIFDF